MNILTKRGALDNIVTYEHVCDTKADIASIPKELITLGSIAIVIEDESEGGGLEAYIANSHKEWFPLVGGGESGGTSGGVSAHICTSNEYNSNTRVPTVQNPEEGTFYLVPVSNVTDSGNVFDEWIYVADADKWEKFGSGGSVVASTQADWEESDSSEASYVQNKPTVYAGEGQDAVVIGSNAKAHATNQGSVAEGSSTATALYAHAEGSATIASGANAHSEGFSTHATAQSSHAEGDYTYATNMGAHAEGGNTNATGERSHAEGDGTHATSRAAHSEGTSTHADGGSSHAEGSATVASGGISHAEGYYTTASGSTSHAEGSNTVASGVGSHAEGYGTIAAGAYQHVGGRYNIAEVIPPNWASDTAYNYGDFVTYGGNRYKCIGENGVQSTTSPLSDTTNWEQTEFNCDYSEIIGGGGPNSPRKNIRTLDWYGNEVLAGSLTANNIHVKDSYLGERYTVLYNDSVALSEQQNDNFIRTLSGTELSLINDYTFKQNTEYRVTIGDEVFICYSYQISTPAGTMIQLGSREKTPSGSDRFVLSSNSKNSSDSTTPLNKITYITWNNNQPDSYLLTIEEISEVITTKSVIANNDITIGSTTITESQLQALLAMLS